MFKETNFMTHCSTILDTLLSMSTAVLKISSCQANTTSRQGIKHLRISFGSIFLLLSYDSSRAGTTFMVAGENPWPLPLNDSSGYL